MELSSETRSKRRTSCWTPLLCSWTVFTTLLCGILIAVLVLLGKEYLTSVCPIDRNRPKLFVSQDAFYQYPRLPTNVQALHYNLTLIPDLTKGSYEGFVNISVHVRNVTSEIILHSKDLRINSIDVKGRNGTDVSLGGFKEIADSQVIAINLKSNVSVGDYYLGLNFSGSLLNKLNGFYLSKYRNRENVTRTIATSKFEPTFARQAFPNFDEPNMKATYEIHLWKPNDPDYIALSNYPQKSEEDYNGGKLVHFEETVSMSTYLVCFIVSDFKCTTTQFNNSGVEVPFSVYATPDQLNKTSYAADVGKKCIEYYVDYFKIPYPLPKLDMVAIPDFSSGAMEHWGLVTYRETALLYTPETHSSANQQRVITVIAHELAHSWFGNLVTMNWWDNLWLNEGFASYIEYKGADAAEPTFGMMEQFLIEDLHPVLSLDATMSSHPIIKEVKTPNQITEVFDVISYNKGASVLRMLETAVGPKNFADGVTNYLNKYKYGNAVTDQLWEEIQKVVGPSVNVSNFMDTFTVQMGYPILNVTVHGNKYVLTQNRFLLDPDTIRKSTESPYNYKWTIPITYVTDQGKSEVVWFKNDEKSIEIERPSNAKWFKFNFDQTGYYRVNYPKDLWKELTENIKNLSIADRAHLIEESFSIAESGAINYDIPLELTKYLKNEIDYVPWSAAASAFEHIGKLLANSMYETEYKNFVLDLVRPAYEKLNWTVEEQDGHLKRLARVVVLKLACSFGDEDALKEANNLLENWLETRTAHPDLREIIYEYGVQNADKITWNKVFDIFVEEKDANEKLKLLKGLTSVRNPSLLSRLIQLAKDDTYIRAQDYFHCLSYMSKNPIGLPIVWDYLRNNWEKIVQRFGLSDRYLGNVLPTITSKFLTKIKITEMENFFNDYPEAGAGAAARVRALENVSNNIKWLEKHQNELEQWILKNSS